MRLSRGLVAGLCLLFASVSSPRAGIGPGNGELGFDFGVTSWDADLLGHTAPMFKLRGGYLFNRWFEVEGQIAYSVHFENQSTSGGQSYGTDENMTQVFVSGVFNFPTKSGNVIPYLLAGIGRTDLTFEHVHVDDASSAWQAGFGSRFFFGDHDQVAFRIEAALLFDDLFDQSNQEQQYAVGFTWRLGRGRS